MTSFPDAGDDSDLREAFQREEWESRRTHAIASLAEANDLLKAGNKDAAEAKARQSLHSFRSALNWAEYGPFEDQAHLEMDKAGRWVRETFGCTLARDGESYSVTCPVSLGHNRIGMSVGGIAQRVCSLCGQDLSECPHLRGRAYLVPGGNDLGWCRVCGAEAACAHSPDETYRVSVGSRILQMELQEVSIVSRPAHPDARFGSLGVSHKELKEATDGQFVPGQDIYCNRCLMPCDGLLRPEVPHG